MPKHRVSLTVICKTDDGNREFRLEYFGVWAGTQGKDAACLLAHFRSGYRSCSIQASIAMLNRFSEYCCLNDFKFPENASDLENLLLIFHEYYWRLSLSPSTKSAAWSAFTQIIRHLQWKGFLPNCVIPRAFHKSQRAQRKLRQSSNHLGLSRAESSELRKSTLSHDPSPPFTQSRLLNVGKFESDDSWLNSYFDDLQNAFDTFRGVAIEEVVKAESDFQTGNRLIANVDITRINEIYESTGTLCDVSAPQSTPAIRQTHDEVFTSLDRLENDHALTALRANGLRAILSGKTASDFGLERGKSAESGRAVIRSAMSIIRELSDRSADAKRVLEAIEVCHSAVLKRRRSSRPINLFSPSRPDGFANLLAWADHIANRVAVRSRGRNSFPGAHLIHSYGSERVRRHLGMTSIVAVAMHAVIVSETGLNLDVVRNMEVDEVGRIKGLTPTDDPRVFVYKGDKPRANGKQTGIFRIYRHNEINALRCLELALLMTKAFRARSGIASLWQYCTAPAMRPADFLMSETMLKNAWHALLEKHHDAIGPLMQRAPSLEKLRVTAGLLEWYRFGGSKEAAAEKLGNSVSTAVSNYIPRELQDALYRRRIRRFQDILIVASTRHEDFCGKALNIRSAEELTRVLETFCVDGIPDHASTKSGYRVEKPSEEGTSQKTLAFIFSPRNAAILMAFRDRLNELNLSHPGAFSRTQVLGGCTVQEWCELADTIETFGNASPDRGHRVAINQARKLIRSDIFKFHFEEILNGTS